MANAQYDVLAGIMDILKANEVKKQQSIVNKQNTDKEVEQKRQFNEQLKLHQQQFDEQVNHNKLAQKAADSIRELQIVKQRSELANTLMQGGEIPGTTIQPITNPNMGQFNLETGQNDYQIHQLPITDGNGKPVSVNLPRPEVFAQRQADLQRIGDAPKNEQRLKEIETTKKADSERVLAQEQADTVRAILQKGYDDRRQQAQITAQNERDRLNRQSREKIAKSRLQSGGADLEPYIKQGAEGTLTIEDVNKLTHLTKDEKIKLINAINGPDNILLTNTQRTGVDQFASLVNAIPYMDKVIQRKPKSDTKLGGVVKGAISNLNSDVDTAFAELEGHLSTIARKLGDEKGPLTEKDVGRARSIVASRYTPSSSDIEKRNDYLKDLNKMIDDKLSGLPKSQINRLKDKIGLYQFTPLDKSGNPTERKTTGKIGEFQPTPEDIKLMEKYGIPVGVK